jgi:hypothetical protein
VNEIVTEQNCTAKHEQNIVILTEEVGEVVAGALSTCPIAHTIE